MELFAKQSISDFNSYEYKEFREGDGGVTFARGSRNNLHMQLKAKNSFSFPSDSFIQLRYTIDKESSVGDAVVGAVAPVNNGFSAFGRAKYRLSNNTIEDIDKPQYTTLIKGLINYSDDYSRGQGQQEGWFPDTGSGLADDDRIWVRNVTDANAPHWPLTLSIASPHVMLINDGLTPLYATGTIIKLYKYINGEKVDVNTFKRLAASSTIDRSVELRAGASAAGGAIITYGTMLVSDEMVFKLKGTRLDIQGVLNTGVLGNKGGISSDGLKLVFTTGLAVLYPNVVSIDDAFTDNIGWAKRRELGVSTERTSDNGYSLWLPARLLFPYLKQHPFLTKGMDQEIVVDMNQVSDFLHRSVYTEACNIDIHKLSWWVPIIEPGIVIENAFNNQLNSGDKRVLSWVTNKYTISPALTSYGSDTSWALQSSTKQPVKVYVFFQLESVRNNQLHNPMVFDHLLCSKIQLEVNNTRKYPDDEYTMQYAKGDSHDYARAYNAYLNGCNATHSADCVPAVSYESFRDLYPLYVFDLRAQDENVWASSTQTDIVVRYRLDTPVDNSVKYNIHVIVDQVRKTTIQTLNGKMINIQ